jgi:hypothetical protein
MAYLTILMVYERARRAIISIILGGAVAAGIALGVSMCAAGCGASVAEYRRHTSECAERVAIILEREDTTREQDVADLAALRAECEAVE